MDFEKMAREIVANVQLGGAAGEYAELANNLAIGHVDRALRAAFAAGREGMRSECANIADEEERMARLAIRTTVSGEREAEQAAAMVASARAIAAAIRALPGKEG